MKFKNNYGGLGFQGVWIPVQYLDEGIAYVKENRIRDVFITRNWDPIEDGVFTVNFDFFKELDFLKSLHVTLVLSKKSNVEGVSHLHHIKDFGWNMLGADFTIDFTNHPFIEKLDIYYSHKLKKINTLSNLKSLRISDLKLDDCELIGSLNGLEELSLNYGTIVSLKGLQELINLKEVTLMNLNKLSDIKDLALNARVERIHIEKCRSLKDYSVLKSCTNIKSLFIENVESLEFIKYLPKLEYFRFGDCKDGNLNPLLDSLSLKNVVFKNKKYYTHKSAEINRMLTR